MQGHARTVDRVTLEDLLKELVRRAETVVGLVHGYVFVGPLPFAAHHLADRGSRSLLVVDNPVRPVVSNERPERPLARYPTANALRTGEPKAVVDRKRVERSLANVGLAFEAESLQQIRRNDTRKSMPLVIES